MTETSEQLRERLRNERNKESINSDTVGTVTGQGDGIDPISDASTAIIGNSTNVSSEDQRDQRSVQGLHNGVRSTKRTTNNVKRKLDDLSRSLAQVNRGERRTDRRSSENNGPNWSNGIDLSTGTTASKRRSVGNLETYEPIPPRSFEADIEREAAIEERKAEGTTSARKRGRPTKQGTSQPILQIKAVGTALKEKSEARKFFTGKTFSKSEAEELKEPLVAALQDEFLILDKALWGLSGDELQQPIWSDLSNKELDTITNIILRAGQRSPLVATATRTAVDGSDYIAAGVILAPRFKSTVDVIRTVRKKQNEGPSRRERLRSIGKRTE
jgi:hypothetical protein